MKPQLPVPRNEIYRANLVTMQMRVLVIYYSRMMFGEIYSGESFLHFSAHNSPMTKLSEKSKVVKPPPPFCRRQRLEPSFVHFPLSQVKWIELRIYGEKLRLQANDCHRSWYSLMCIVNMKVYKNFQKRNNPGK